MTRRLSAFWHDETGTTAMEYALLGTLVAVAIAGTFAVLGDGLFNVFNSAAANTLIEQTALIP
jgi:Flp pilus assembly pilin Flp